jgi:energy-coupling factor transporter ATP-binding protein EcfA2
MNQIQLAPDGTSQVAIIGNRGSGKTTLARKLAGLWPLDRVYVYDPLDEYADLVDQTCYDAAEVVDAFENGAKRVRLARGIIADAATLLEYIRELDHILVVQDEADKILDPCRKCNPEAFLWINDYGRHVGQGMISLARRVASLPRDFTAQSILCFKPALEPNDIEYIRKRLGGDELPPLAGPWDWYAQDMDRRIVVIPGAWIAGN